MPKAVLLLVGGLLAAGPLQAAEVVDYTRDVKPILASRCFACHGALKQESSLRLDAASLIQKGSDSGAIVVPGNSAESLLIRKATAGEGERMPPEGEPLSSEQIDVLTAWIEQGAQAPDEPVPADPREHWSFQPPVRPPVPAVTDENGISAGANPIDAFLSAKQREMGLEPTPQAAKHVLLRRVYLDLIGLPPTPDELHAFRADPSEDAYEKVVERLLASAQYGERWGRHWMDVWRYSDWAGFAAEVRYSQKHIWRWRDWIIEALNTDKGYDQMVVEMLAADEAAPTEPQAVRATGFLARNWYLFNRNSWIDNTIEHTSKAFLGITFNCARCHDHKYDPIAQEDYYRLRAFFEPHQVRLDRVPGQLDLNQDGLARVYDKDAAAPTYLFERGNEAHPVTGKPLAPGLPEALGSVLQIEPVPLPPAAYYPALNEFQRREAVAQAEAGVEQAHAALAQAKLAVGAAAQAVNGPEATGESGREQAAGTARDAAALAERVLATAQANLAALQARIAAEVAKYSDPPALDVQELALAAGAAHREYLVRKAAEDVLRAEQELAAAKQGAAPMQAAGPETTQTPADEKAAAALADAEKKLADAQMNHDQANAALPAPSADYPPLGEVFPATSTGRRLALARWIINRRNPLAARVAVNHIWLRHFGAPLVSSVFDFGMNGQPPTHPELLDWLAVEFMEQAWSMKHLHRLMVTSQAYRRDSVQMAASPNLAIDPDNHYLWRANSRRMEAETVRDSVLYVSGQLDATMGGPDLDQNQGQTSRRRSLYFRHAYEKKMLFLTLFDGANENECYRRTTSIIPQQALALANSQLSKNQSRLLARQLAGEFGADDAFVVAAFEQVLSRTPSPQELEECLRFLADQAALLSDPSRLTPVATGAVGDVQPAADPHARARENLVHVLLNHHDFVTIR